MALLQLVNLRKSLGARTLLDAVDLRVDAGERIGLIGVNGSGKSTLLRLLAGEIELDSGQYQRAKTLRVGYLPQDPELQPGFTVMQEAELAFAELHALADRLRDIEHALADAQGAEIDRLLKSYEQAQQRFEHTGGFAWRHRLEAVLRGVGLAPETWGQRVESLSGGQRSRLSLARLLVQEIDLLLLDEPTNHLDLDAVEWLQDYLAEFRGAVLMVSHDRYLLDAVCNRVVHLHDARLDDYRGNYSTFLEQRAQRQLAQQREWQKQQAYIEKQQEFIARFKAGQRSREARGRATRLQRLLDSGTLADQVRQDKGIHLKIDCDLRAGDQVVKVEGLSKAYGALRLWRDVAFTVHRGRRIGVIGPNGSGKTSLLLSLLGHADADAGEVHWGANLRIGYYSQTLDELTGDGTVLEEVWGEGATPLREVREALGMMLFRDDDVEKPVSVLSGGERARLRFAQLLLEKPNVLILDEPTNHLDIASCEALEQALAGFGGTILCVSHDRRFLDHVVTDLLVLENGGVRPFAGNYSAWRRWCRENAALAADRAASARSEATRAAARVSTTLAASAPGATAAGPKRKDNPYLRKHGRLSVEELEERIIEAETELADCQQAFGDPAVMRDAASARELQIRFERVQKDLKELEEEYALRAALG